MATTDYVHADALNAVLELDKVELMMVYCPQGQVIQLVIHLGYNLHSLDVCSCTALELAIHHLANHGHVLFAAYKVQSLDLSLIHI